MTQSNPDTDRRSLLARIRKLAAFTEANGATEAEAATAASMIADLIARHNITEDERSIREDASGCTMDQFTELNAADDWIALVPVIARVYHCRAWFATRTEDPLGLGMVMRVRHVRYFGTALDAAAATATVAIVYTALQSAAKAFRGGRASFRAGMVARLEERLRELIPPEQPWADTGSALMVLKDQLVTAEFAKLNLRLGVHRQRPGTTRANPAAFAAGAAAGSRADLASGARLYGHRAIAGPRHG